MNFRHFYSLFACLTFTTFFACTEPPAESNELIVQSGEATQLDSEIGAIAQEFLEWVEDYQETDEIPGVAVALVKGDEIILLEGLGDRDVEQGLPVTPDTLFHIGSTHKSMTALLMATLVDDGIVDWDTPAIAIDPAFILETAASTKTVTLRHLLSMRSGIPDDAEDGFAIESEAEDLFDYVAEVELLGTPGEVFSYSNLSASLAGYLAVLAMESAGKPVAGNSLYEKYGQLLGDRLLTPIGMTRSTILDSRARADSNHSRSYTYEGGELQESDPDDIDGDALAPSGSLKASITDMARYILTQVNNGVDPNGDRLVSEENLQETWQPRWGNYALGWEVNQIQGVQVISHEGSYDNYLSVIGIIPTYDVGFVILSNADDAAEALITDTPDKLVEMLGN
ncbi:MAG: beta-lactamase family protein [Limnothrix sp. RL_2_0]|nr:beta-lactamase family protein [Limnothrix sp. RL_2_0]